MAMKKKAIIAYDEKLSLIRILFFGVFSIVLLSAFYLSLFPAEVQLSPSSQGISFETARSLLSTMGPEGIDWYCEKTPSYADKQGNTYGAVELEELKKILGNDALLKQEFCS